LSPASFLFFENGMGFLKLILMGPLTEVAPRIEIELALTVNTLTIAAYPFGAQL
jgi:hypothetical protein